MRSRQNVEDKIEHRATADPVNIKIEEKPIFNQNLAKLVENVTTILQEEVEFRQS